MNQYTEKTLLDALEVGQRGLPCVVHKAAPMRWKDHVLKSAMALLRTRGPARRQTIPPAVRDSALRFRTYSSWLEIFLFCTCKLVTFAQKSWYLKKRSLEFLHAHNHQPGSSRSALSPLSVACLWLQVPNR